jgi:hypothetical protein
LGGCLIGYVMGAWLLACPAGAFSLVLDLDVSVERITHPLFEMEGLRLQAGKARAEGQGGSLQIARLRLMNQQFRDAKITCRRLILTSGAFRCEAGEISQAGIPIAAVDIWQSREAGQDWWLLRFPQANQRYWQIRYGGQDDRLRIEFVDADLKAMGTLLAAWPPLAGLMKKVQMTGWLSGTVDYVGKQFSSTLTLREGGYSLAGSDQAAEKLDMTFVAVARNVADSWHGKATLGWQAGVAYYAPLLVQGQGQQVHLAGELGAAGWRLSTATLDWPRIGTVTAAGNGSTTTGDFSLTLDAPRLQLAPLGDTVVTPMLVSQGKPGATLEGQASIAARWQHGRMNRLAFVPEEAGVALEGNRFALAGLNGRLDWEEATDGNAMESHLSVRHFALGRLVSGAFDLPMLIWPQKSFALARPVRIPLQDGELIINFLTAGLTGAGNASGDLEGALGLELTSMSLEKLTTLLDLPVMRGTISANLPTIRYARREASLDGALVIHVFDGDLKCRELRLMDPFGPHPRILANVGARHIDLEQLTQTFSFGSISGFVDADLRDLEIIGWKPVAFNGSVRSSPGDYPRRISQRAVNNITALSGGGAMAALQAGVLSMFADFGYRRMGLGCRLENGVCHMRGIRGNEQDDQYTIIEGGGIPALTVMGYNRRIDWEELITRLKAAIASSGPEY